MGEEAVQQGTRKYTGGIEMTEKERHEAEIRSIMAAIAPKAEEEPAEKPAKKQTKKTKEAK